MIELRDLRFTYTEGGFGLEVDSLSISPGQRVGWIGPSGSGKTTLLHLVAGIVAPSAGRVITCGKELTAIKETPRRDFRISNIGLVFQDFALLDYLSVLDNILLPYRVNRSLRLDALVRDRAQQLAVNVGLGEMLERRPPKLSQGERQRVAICRALVTNPQLILADEPTANLDLRNTEIVFDILDGYAKQQNTTLIIVTHDQDILNRFDETTDVSKFCSPSSSGKVGGNNA